MRRVLLIGLSIGAAALGSTIVFGSGGSSGVLPATTTTAGTMSANDKQKLNGLESTTYGTLTATGTAQATCTPITTTVANVTAGDNKAVCLPASGGLSVGDVYEVLCSTSANPGGNAHTCLVFPASGDTITPLSADAADTMLAQTVTRYRFKGSSTWAAEPGPMKLDTNYSVLSSVKVYGDLNMVSSLDANTAEINFNGGNGNQLNFITCNGVDCSNVSKLPQNATIALTFTENGTDTPLLRFVNTANAKEVQLIGEQGNVAAPSGYVGQLISSCIAPASGVTLTNNTAANITSITVAGGDWDFAAVGGLNGSLTGTDFQVGISGTSGTLPASSAKGDTLVESPIVSSATADITLDIPMSRQLVASGGATIYLVAQTTIAAGTAKGYGCLKARRRR